MKKIATGLGLVLAIGAVTLGATACGGGNGGEKTIEVLVQTADHGWTGAVQSYAQEKVAELNKAGKYKVNLTACESATVEANKVADLLTHKETLHGIVMLPIDNTMEATVTKVAKEGVPFVQFDRVIKNEAIDGAASRVANVLGDNYGIGVATAEAFIAHGIKATDKVLIMPGDNSSVPVSRTSGFKETLMKKGGWTQAQVDAIDQTDYTNWSRQKARELFVAKGDAICNYQWIFTHDSEIAMGILEELKGSVVSQNVKDHFKNGGIKSLASSSGLDEMYAVLEGKHKADYTTGDKKVLDTEKTYLFDVTYDPAMIQIAIQDLVDHLEGKTVAKDHVVPVNNVDSTNVKDYRGFGRNDDYRK